MAPLANTIITSVIFTAILSGCQSNLLRASLSDPTASVQGLDPKIEIGKEHGKAYSLRYCFNIVSNEKYILSYFINTIKVGTPTFRHGNGANNFVNDSRPLGWHYGSDARKINIGLNYLMPKILIFNFKLGMLEKGTENILNRPYDPYSDYQKSTFPTGPIAKIIFANLKIHWKMNKFLSVTNESQITFFQNYESKWNFSFGFIYSYF